MPVPELEKFREKYPQYNDMSDTDIANKLATKYPDAYGDLPQKVQSEQPTQGQPQEQPQLKSIYGPTENNWVAEGIKQTIGDTLITPGLHFANQASPIPNLPRAILHKAGFAYPEAQSAVGTALAKGAGVLGAYVNPIGAVIKGGSLTGKLMPKIWQGVKAGALYGGAYTPTEDMVGIPQRITGAGIGAVTGGLLTGASEGIQTTIRRARLPAKISPEKVLSALTQQSEERYSGRLEKVKGLSEEAKAKSKSFVEERGIAKQQLSWDSQDVRRVINDDIRKADLELKSSILQIDKDIQKSAESGSVSFQEKLPDFFKSNSKSYGKRLDVINEALISTRGISITKGELNDIIQNTIFDITPTGISQGQPNAYLSVLSEKYGLKTSMDKFGNIVTDANTPVNFKQAIYDIRSIWKTISGQAKQGKFTDNDIAAAMLQKNWGQWVEKYAPELQELNKSYKPVIQAMKESARIFKPAQGEIATKTAENFLSRLGKGKELSGGERKLLEMLEQGTKFSPGVGEISQGIKTLGKDRVTAIVKHELQRASLQQELSDKLTGFEQKQRDIAQSINQNKGFLQSRLKEIENIEQGITQFKTGREKQLIARKEEIMQLMANRDKAHKIRNALLVGGAVAGGTSIPYSVWRIINRLRTNG